VIARTWRGAVRAADADAYADYIRQTGLAAYAATPGNLGAWLMYRIEGDRAEVETISLWESMDAIHAFAGEDVERAVFYPEDDRYLVDRDLTAHHWVVAGRVP
jgi:heme-degrading monooxygenase HmoA